MNRMKLITLTLALLATLLVFTACGNPISEIVHGDPPQAGTPDASDPLSPEPEPEPEETEEQRRARLIKRWRISLRRRSRWRTTPSPSMIR